MSAQLKKSRPVAAPVSRRRLWLPVGLVVLGALVLSIVFFALRGGNAENPAAGAQDGPSVAVDQEVFDYGDVKVNTPIETIFRVRNAGSETLKIAGNPEVELVEGC